MTSRLIAAFMIFALLGTSVFGETSATEQSASTTSCLQTAYEHSIDDRYQLLFLASGVGLGLLSAIAWFKSESVMPTHIPIVLPLSFALIAYPMYLSAHGVGLTSEDTSCVVKAIAFGAGEVVLAALAAHGSWNAAKASLKAFRHGDTRWSIRFVGAGAFVVGQSGFMISFLSPQSHILNGAVRLFRYTGEAIGYSTVDTAWRVGGAVLVVLWGADSLFLAENCIEAHGRDLNMVVVSGIGSTMLAAGAGGVLYMIDPVGLVHSAANQIVYSAHAVSNSIIAAYDGSKQAIQATGSFMWAQGGWKGYEWLPSQTAIAYGVLGTACGAFVLSAAYGIHHLKHAIAKNALETCCICLETTVAESLLCGHRFHPLCIAQWAARLGTAASCPMCRRAILPS